MNNTSPLATDIPQAVWIKSSHSGGEGNCVEVADVRSTAYEGIAIRDSKNPEGPALVFQPASFAAFVSSASGRQLSV